ncbi:MAG: TetR/AcrR family transcriptional regulator [Sulfobacillus sp.]
MGGGVVTDKRVAIYQAASRLFEESGYHDTSVEDIATAVGLSKPSLYHYISGKQDLLYAIARETIQAFHDDLDRLSLAPMPVGERLVRWVRGHALRMAAERETVAVLFREGRHLTGDERRLVAELADAYVLKVQQMIEQGVADQVFSVADCRVAALHILGSLNWMNTWYRPGGRLGAEQIADQMAHMALASLRSATVSG